MTPLLSHVDYTGSSSHGTTTTTTAAATKRKSLRRQSGLLSIDTENLAPPRPASPAFGSPIRLEAGRAEEAEEIAVLGGNFEQIDAEPEHESHDDDQQYLSLVPKKEKRKSKSSKEKELAEEEREKEYAVDSIRSREKKRYREDDGDPALQGTKGKLKDVNSRAPLQPIDRNIGELTSLSFGTPFRISYDRNRNSGATSSPRPGRSSS
jgi:hypothetical protein